MEKLQQGNLSENEDDPEVYESSGDEWNEEVEEKKRGNRRTSQRLSKKPRISHVELSSDSDAENKKKKSKNGIKRPKLDDELDSEDPAVEDEEEEESEGEGDGDGDGDGDDDDGDGDDDGDEDSPKQSFKNNAKRGPAIGSKIAASDFVNGGFLILKKDAQEGDAGKPCLWRIDGKALLQKYEAVEEEGQLRHKNTSIYTGWSSMDKDMYYPVTVKVLQHQGQNMTVELNWEKLKELNNESE